MSESVRHQPSQAVKMITLRVPVWLHEAVDAAAHKNMTSMNQFCIDTLSRRLREGEVDPFQHQPKRAS